MSNPFGVALGGFAQDQFNTGQNNAQVADELTRQRLRVVLNALQQSLRNQRGQFQNQSTVEPPGPPVLDEVVPEPLTPTAPTPTAPTTTAPPPTPTVPIRPETGTPLIPLSDDPDPAPADLIPPPEPGTPEYITGARAVIERQIPGFYTAQPAFDTPQQELAALEEIDSSLALLLADQIRNDLAREQAIFNADPGNTPPSDPRIDDIFGFPAGRNVLSDAEIELLNAEAARAGLTPDRYAEARIRQQSVDRLSAITGALNGRADALGQIRQNRPDGVGGLDVTSIDPVFDATSAVFSNLETQGGGTAASETSRAALAQREQELLSGTIEGQEGIRARRAEFNETLLESQRLGLLDSLERNNTALRDDALASLSTSDPAELLEADLRVLAAERDVDLEDPFNSESGLTDDLHDAGYASFEDFANNNLTDAETEGLLGDVYPAEDISNMRRYAAWMALVLLNEPDFAVPGNNFDNRGVALDDWMQEQFRLRFSDDALQLNNPDTGDTDRLMGLGVESARRLAGYTTDGEPGTPLFDLERLSPNEFARVKRWFETNSISNIGTLLSEVE